MQPDIKTTTPRKSTFKRFIRVCLLIGIVVASVIIWWNYFYVFGEGVKSGQLNYIVKKGNIFKTFEGKLIQTGFKSKGVGAFQSYDFEFSVVDDSIANVLMNNSGKYFELHYKEYKHSVPWRGYTCYIVDKIIGTKEVDH